MALQRNTLVDDNGIACLSEYGLELVLREEASSNLFRANVRWMAPEVISSFNKNKRVSVDDGKRADVYSLAMVMFEVCYPSVSSFERKFQVLTLDPRP